MRQSEARDLRSFLAEPVEEIMLEGAGARLINPQEGCLEHADANPSSRYVGVPLTSPWEEVPASQYAGSPLTSPWELPGLPGAQSGLAPLRPYRLQRYQSRGVPMSLTRSTSGTLRLRPADSKERRTTADLAPAPQKIVPIASSPALQSWERRRRDIYTWLVLLMLFLLVILGGIGLDSLIASYR